MSSKVLKFDLIDRLRKNCLAHFAMCKILKRHLFYDWSQNNAEAEFIADTIFEELWLEGFKIVPRDDVKWPKKAS